ncbi:MAG: PaaI family thioesterase, partial [Firmicutes bacterium]|nr:PaaI family thioesterase [Bacillota bacterium]
MADTPARDNPCLICGPRTAVGLHVRFRPGPGPDEVQAETTVDARFSGFQGVVHGGIVAGLLDDAMWYTAFFRDRRITMTAALEVRYRAPVPVGRPL